MRCIDSDAIESISVRPFKSGLLDHLIPEAPRFWCGAR
jgi:hypothetical protein